MVILLYALVVFGYLGVAAWAWRRATPAAHPVALAGMTASGGGAALGPAEGRVTLPERTIVLVVWLMHLWLLLGDFAGPAGMRFGFASALSATLWLAVLLYWVESLYFSLAGMRLLIFPLAAICAVLPLWFPGSALLAVTNATSNPAFDAHLVVALAAYSLLTIAALHALLMAALDRWLHRAEATQSPNPSLLGRIEQALLTQLPPLLTMERLLFRLVGAGFVLLTLTVLTGVVFSEALFGQPLRADHKTVFTLIAWLIFAALLVGRRLYGWRGRVALRWTLAGFVALLLAYAGSRFVLEVILHRV